MRGAEQRKDRTDEARERKRDVHAKENQAAKYSKKKTVPAKTGEAKTEMVPAKTGEETQRDKTFQYVCPYCKQAVTSSVRTGRVDHRCTCGNRFQVTDGCIIAKALAYAYVCPACNGQVASNIATGQMDHGNVCGHKLSVKEGAVAGKSFRYTCPFCNELVRQVIRKRR